jgi:heterotetrameric sarcosine oxidase gamma subunit
MSDANQLRSPLDPFWSRAREWNVRHPAGVHLSELSFRDQIIVRGEATDPEFHRAVQQHLGLSPQVMPNTYSENDGFVILWLGPNEWLVLSSTASNGKLAASLSSAVRGIYSAVVDVSHHQPILRIGGARTLEVLRKGCSLDLRAPGFGAHCCAQTLMAKAAVVLRWVDAAPTFDLIVRRSFAEYLALWVADAAQEYGIAIGEGEFSQKSEGVRAKTQQP